MIVRRSADLLGVALRGDGPSEIARRSRGTPRIANRLLRRVRDYAEVARGRGRSPGISPGPRSTCTRWTRKGWTGWTGPC